MYILDTHIKENKHHLFTILVVFVYFNICHKIYKIIVCIRAVKDSNIFKVNKCKDFLNVQISSNSFISKYPTRDKYFDS